METDLGVSFASLSHFLRRTSCPLLCCALIIFRFSTLVSLLPAPIHTPSKTRDDWPLGCTDLPYPLHSRLVFASEVLTGVLPPLSCG
jgi:hypothetical protein